MYEHPLQDGDYGNNYSGTDYLSGPIVGAPPQGNQGGSSFGISLDPLSAGSSIINSIAQLFTNKKNREFAAQQARLQNQWNLEQWYRENAYNTPAAQMQRYIEAGLNPNLIVGQQNLSASSPQMVSGKDAPAGVAPRVDLGQASLQAAQIRNLNANTDLQEAQAMLPEEQVKLIQAQFDFTSAQAKQALAAIQVTWLSVEEMQSRININKEEAESKGLANSIFRENYNSARSAAAARNWIDVQKATTFYKLQDLAVQEAKARINASNANAAYLSSLKKQVESLTPEMRDYYIQLATYYNNLSSKTASEKQYQDLVIKTYELFGVKQAEADYERTQRQDRTWYFNLFYDVNQSLMSPIDGFQEWLYGNLNPGSGASGRW